MSRCLIITRKHSDNMYKNKQHTSIDWLCLPGFVGFELLVLERALI